MRSPLNSRRNNRPGRVAPDEASVLAAWKTVMVGPLVSQLLLDPRDAQPGQGFPPACFGLQLASQMLPEPAKPRKSRQIAANEMPYSRTSDQVRSRDGWRFSGPMR